MEGGKAEKGKGGMEKLLTTFAELYIDDCRIYSFPGNRYSKIDLWLQPEIVGPASFGAILSRRDKNSQAIWGSFAAWMNYNLIWTNLV